MFKKILAVILAATMLFSAGIMMSFAEDPVEYKYVISEDPDFMGVVSASAGNDKATILKEGDTLFIPANANITVVYNADIDIVSAGEWKAVNKSLMAFSLSGTAGYPDYVAKAAHAAKNNIYTVIGINGSATPQSGVAKSLDFTIPYPEQNKFVGWVLKDVTFGTSVQLNLYALWEKQASSEEEEISDVEYIFNANATIAQKVTAPFFKLYKSYSNTCVNVLQGILDKMLGTETPAVENMGTYLALVQRIKLTIEIICYSIDTVFPWAFQD